MAWWASREGRKRVNERVVPRPGDPPPVDPGRGRRLRRSLRLALMVALPCLFGVAALGGVYYAADRASRYLNESSGFRVERIDVAGNERLAAEEVLRRAGLAPGTSIFDLDIREARRRLLEDPWIVKATVDKRLPATVVVRIAERRALAVLAGPELHLVAEDGSVIQRTSTAGAPDLPVLTGFDLERRRSDPVGLREELTAAVALLRLIDEVGLPGHRTVAEIHRSVRGGFDLLTGDGLRVRLGRGPYRPVLRRLAEVVAALAARGAAPSEIHLAETAHPGRVTVRVVP
jgi:cell division protein FtsQ